MKLKNISVAALASFLLVIFLPVFGYVIFIGNNMNYNSLHKIYAIYGNKVLLALVLAGVLAFLLLIFSLRKIPYNRYTVIGFVVFALIGSGAFYFVNVEISKCIAFYGGWDCGMVANSARWVYEGEGLGHGVYYNIYTNNVPITWLLHKLYVLAIENPVYPYNPEFVWIQFQCLMHAAAVFFSAMAVLLVCKRISFALLVFVINSVLLTLSPWKIIPYTDASTIAAPVFVIFLYAVFSRMKSAWKYLLWLFLAFAGLMGGVMKATCYVPLIAVVIIEFIGVFGRQRKAARVVKELLLYIVLLLGAYALASACKHGMYQEIGFEYDRDLEIGWTAYLYDGLDEETTGACSGGGFGIAYEFQGQSKATRVEYEWKCIKERLQEKGFGGLLDFWLRKLVMTYNDGTFSWFQEGAFHAWEYEEITDSSRKEALRSFFWDDGENYQQFITVSHGMWLFVLVGVLCEAFVALINAILRLKGRKPGTEQDSSELSVCAAVILHFVGLFFFMMLFEGRARYLYNSVAVFATMAVLGYCKFVDLLVLYLPEIRKNCKVRFRKG